MAYGLIRAHLNLEQIGIGFWPMFVKNGLVLFLEPDHSEYEGVLMKQETRQRPSSKPIWIEVAILYFVYLSFYAVMVYARWRGWPLP